MSERTNEMFLWCTSYYADLYGCVISFWKRKHQAKSFRQGFIVLQQINSVDPFRKPKTLDTIEIRGGIQSGFTTCVL